MANKQAKLEDILIENSTYANTHRLKLKLISAKVLKEECSECGIGPQWNGKSLSLQLDHVNGINNDNRIENLRILCPNCHSQTKTYAAKNTKRKAAQLACKECSKSIWSYSTTYLCKSCAALIRERNKREITFSVGSTPAAPAN